MQNMPISTAEWMEKRNWQLDLHIFMTGIHLSLSMKTGNYISVTFLTYGQEAMNIYIITDILQDREAQEPVIPI